MVDAQGAMTFRITTPCMNDIQHDVTKNECGIFNCWAECHNEEGYYTKCRYSDCHCGAIIQNDIMLNVVILTAILPNDIIVNLIMLNGIMLTVICGLTVC